jgi:hypothetical protein
MKTTSSDPAKACDLSIPPSLNTPVNAVVQLVTMTADSVQVVRGA